MRFARTCCLLPPHMHMHFLPFPRSPCRAGLQKDRFWAWAEGKLSDKPNERASDEKEESESSSTSNTSGSDDDGSGSGSAATGGSGSGATPPKNQAPPSTMLEKPAQDVEAAMGGKEHGA